MINSISIHNFKNHADTSLGLGRLTILTGINGMGKSSVMQSMLLLRDSYLRNRLMNTLYLDGLSCRVGGSSGLVNGTIAGDNDPDKFRMKIKTDDDACIFSYVYPLGDETELSWDSTCREIDADKLVSIPIFTDDFQYLSAFRFGPQEQYPAGSSTAKNHRQLSSQLGKGENTAYFLSQFGNEDIPVEELKHSPQSSLKLSEQTELWMGEISPNIAIKIDQPGDRIQVSYGYKVEGQPTHYHSAMNTGFGLSYILSVVVAVLSARRGALLMIENPEAHIHPSGQSALMKLITKAAAAGVQIILETHSDHIVNGALVNLKRGNIKREELAIYYFHQNDQLNAVGERLDIGVNYRIKHAPKGFFDQMGMDLEELYDFN